MSNVPDVFPARPIGRDSSKFGYPSPPARRQNFLTLIACLAIGIAIFATAAGSLTNENAAAVPRAAMDWTTGLIDSAFAELDAATTNSAASRLQTLQKQDPCVDFTFFFLNAKCSTVRRKHIARGRHAPAIN